MIVLIFMLHVHCAFAGLIAYFVSPSGSDMNSGLNSTSAFLTFQRAQLAVRNALNTSVQTGDALVTVLPGTYVSREPLLFTAADSGRNGFKVVWSCSEAVLYVGAVLSDWAPSPLGPNIFVTNITSLAPPAPPPPAGCGLVEPGWSYDNNDIREVLVGDVGAYDNTSACCQACGEQPGCKAWSLCVNITCGVPGVPVNCYLKSSAAGRRWFGPLRTSGTLPPNATPSAPAPWRFFTLTEGALGATIARIPNRGSGYLGTLGVGNSDSSLWWPAGSPFFPNASFDVSNAHVFCNIGADWFTETRPVTSINTDSHTLHFEGSSNGVGGCNDKVYLQGPREFLDEPGEWALEPSTGLLHYWPYDAAASIGRGATQLIVAAVDSASIQFMGGPSLPVSDVEIVGLEIRGSGFTPDGSYRIFPPGRPNDFPAPTNSGMIRVENAARIGMRGCKLLNAGLSAVWLAGASENITVSGCWIEGPGFCGIPAAGIFPGDGPYTSAAQAHVNKGHVIDSNLIYDVGKRVGHGAGVWLWQSGENAITRNYIKESPRNGVGMYGVRFGAGGGLEGGTLPDSLYNVTLDFFSSLEVLTTRNNTVAFNRVENVVRDSCDGGAFESWGVGVGNTFHTNSVSDCDSGGVDGSWMNFLFQDDASHWMNHSSNVVFHVAGKGSEETTMVKSIYSVSENNVFAYSQLGFLVNLQPYIEPAAAMVFSRNIFAHLTSSDSPTLDYSLNGECVLEVCSWWRLQARRSQTLPLSALPPARTHAATLSRHTFTTPSRLGRLY